MCQRKRKQRCVGKDKYPKPKNLLSESEMIELCIGCNFADYANMNPHLSVDEVSVLYESATVLQLVVRALLVSC